MELICLTSFPASYVCLVHGPESVNERTDGRATLTTSSDVKSMKPGRIRKSLGGENKTMRLQVEGRAVTVGSDDRTSLFKETGSSF